MLTDPIADMLTRIRNAIQARKFEISFPHSKQKLAILQILEQNGFIKSVKESKKERFPELVVELDPARSLTLLRVSKPGRRIYFPASSLKPVLSGMGIAVVSTSAGMMTNNEAHKRGIGGEIICEIY